MRWILPLVAVAALVTATPASADTFTVTGTVDLQSPSCNGNACQSIRAALAAVEGNPGADTILVPAGDHNLTQGALTVDSPVTIRGAGARATVVRSDIEFRDRVFDVGAVTVTISGLTMADGIATANTGFFGGNLRNSGGEVLLDHVRVTGGSASSGGGLSNNTGTMTVQHSLVHANAADSGGADAGGIQNFGTATVPGVLAVRDSTIAFNNASLGGGIFSWGSASNVTRLERVTVANNSANGRGIGGLGIGEQGQTFEVRASIVSGNLFNGEPSNCGSPTPTSLGANLESGSDCAFTGAGDRQAADALLTQGLVNAGGQTDVFALGAGSPAINLAGACTGSDQRDLPRPQGGVCDSGAFEVDQAPETALSATPPTFRFSSPEPGTSFQCRLDGPAGPGAFAPCVSPLTYSGLAPGDYRFFVRAVDGAGTPDPTPPSAAFTVPQPQPQPSPEPDAGESVVVDELSGTIRVKVPGGGYVPLNTLTEIPDGSTVDTRRGVVRLSFEPRNGGTVQTAKFYDGIFKVNQKKRILELKLVEKLARCKSGQANAAARKKKRRLWGSGKGRFRTSGRYSSATVRGTKWLTQDSCAGTLTRVVRGKVAVLDRVKKKTIIVRKGKKYLARPKP